MTRNIFTYLALLLALLGVTSSCEDRLDYPARPGEGTSTVKVEVGFKSFAPALSRAAGDAIKDINSLWLVIYATDGTLVSSEPVNNFASGRQPNTRPDGNPSSESETGRATFDLTLPNGQYRAYAIANMSLAGVDVSTEEKLRSVSAAWDPDDISRDAAMFGWFVNGDRTTDRDNGFAASPITIKKGATLHAWLSRAASKVTVAIDGSGLYDGVEVFIKSVQVRDIPDSCHIGKDNTATEGHIIDGERLVIDETMSNEGPSVTNASPYLYLTSADGDGAAKTGNSDLEQAHTDLTPALYFYENLQGQGRDKRQQDADKDGKPDNADIVKDDKPFGSFIEVKAYYISTNPKRPGRGEITYRFMLGKDEISDYDAERNHHYKLTLLLKYFANDPDWHIEYDRQVLEVSTPLVFNYQGKVFVPTAGIPNADHDFEPDNPIRVNSYLEDSRTGESSRREEPWTATFEYLDANGNPVTSDNPPAWLPGFPSSGDGSTTINAKAEKIASVDVNIDNELTKNSFGGVGSPHNLAGSSADAVENTANCYMVGGTGYFSIPLVYGNAREDNKDNSDAYELDAVTDGIGNCVDYLGNSISSPYILNGIANKTGYDAALVWQDEEGLVTGITFLPDAYGKKGGISFQVARAVQGNAVIALLDPQKRVVWSWHIWVTILSAMEQDITVTAHDNTLFDLMAVNLGWCSKHGEAIKYFKRRECKVTFKARKMTSSITIVQESHTAFPSGNNPYYQWGRKDPFIGAVGQWTNKTRQFGPASSETKVAGIWGGSHPAKMFDEFEKDGHGVLSLGYYQGENRKTTREILPRLIQHPDLWHNPPRDSITGAYTSLESTYADLWGNGNRNIKTVYDPCPVGYHVGGNEVYSGFTTLGRLYNPEIDGDLKVEETWYDVRFTNIPDENYTTPANKNCLFEFYTNPEKIKSIIFPLSGYRDWDNSAAITFFGNPDDNTSNSIGYAWSSQILIATGTKGSIDAAYNFEFSRNMVHGVTPGTTGYIRPDNAFVTRDGFPVRPCRYTPLTE